MFKLNFHLRDALQSVLATTTATEVGARTRELEDTLNQIVQLRAGRELSEMELAAGVADLWTDLHNSNEGNRRYVLAAARDLLTAERHKNGIALEAS